MILSSPCQSHRCYPIPLRVLFALLNPHSEQTLCTSSVPGAGAYHCQLWRPGPRTGPPHARRIKKEPEEGQDEKKKETSVIHRSFDNMGRELISLISTTLREIGKRDVEAPTKADETTRLPLAQKMSTVFDRCEDKTVRTELVEGLGNVHLWL